LQNSETFTRKTLIFSEIQPKGEEVKAKNEKRRTRACTRALGLWLKLGAGAP